MRAALCLALLLAAGTASADRVTGATEALAGFRGKMGLPPLVHSGQLQQAAERHARELLQRDGLSHKGRDGAGVGERVKRTGYRYCTVAENIARGQKSLDAVMLDWATSDGHRANMLLSNLRDYGLARERGNIWVLVLAAPGC